MVVRLLSAFMIAAILLTLLTLFVPQLLNGAWVVLCGLLVIGFGCLAFVYVRKTVLLLKNSERNENNQSL
ncbi:hypothetical protein MUO14_21280 [Halobacillus shinanisalinarum]|uniref:Uncharacterized protein n=1 Tax=Halobacillus shinanisalinarum TaxID=2932258 RepID=A0ABY4GXJ1_9BACI|nr:hypothetical protein [Halobacillus shinanisalinarum]UOQ92905.1 hypothetical protein MUO14_21280 [Halobacillus shinanisalinarum]